MRFSDIKGNQEVKNALASMVNSGKVPHAIMFHENEGCGGIAMAMAFLQYLMCGARDGVDSCGECPTCNKINKLIHPDIHFIFPVASGSKVSTDKPTSESYAKYWRELVVENPFFLDSDLNAALGIESKSSVIAVAEAKGVIDTLALSALEGGYRCIVVYLPEKMNAETANRLLKSIEEPPELTQFVFITHAPEKVLVTISSRCLAIRLLPLSREEVAEVLVERFGKNQVEATDAAAMSGGSVGKALSYLAEAEEAEADFQLLSSLLRALAQKDLSSALDAGEAMAALPSREKQKAFCKYMAEAFRSIFMLQQKMPQMVSAPEREMSLFQEIAPRVRRTFPRQAEEYMNRAYMLIERNVNQKILFCDMVDRLYTMV